MTAILQNRMILLIAISLIKMGVFLGAIMSLAGILTWAERKMSALMQDRVGPNRASILGFSFIGLFHPMADGIKLMMKEDFMPKNANKIIFTLAPIIALVPILTVLSVIPFGNYVDIAGFRINLQIADIPLGLFFLLAVSSLSIYGTFLGGWASKNNFAILGSIRAAAQMISYEVILGLTLVGILMIYGSASLQDIVRSQGKMIFGFIPAWGIVYQFPAFILFMIASLAENKRTPFDLVEGESEIIGYFIEYSSMRFATFMFGEFAEIALIACVATTFFLGGWQIPFLGESGFLFPGGFSIALNHYIVVLMQISAFASKVLFMSWFMLLIRWTLPRVRFDQMMKLSWERILPLALLNIVATGAVLTILKNL